MDCLSQQQCSQPQLLSVNGSSTPLQNHLSLAKLKHLDSSKSHCSSVLSQRNGKRSLDDLSETLQVEGEKGLKKPKKDEIDSHSLHSASEEIILLSVDKEDNMSLHLPNNLSEGPENPLFKVNERDNLYDMQEDLHCKLKPKVAKLCEVLKFPEHVKGMAESFLEYVMNNHHVNRESETILQALQISLCWTAASLLKHKLDHKESLALAKQHLKFGCQKKEAEYVYSMLRCLKRVFLYCNSPKAASTTQGFSADRLQTTGQEFSDDQVLSQLGLAQKDVSNSIIDVQKKFHRKKKKLSQKQQEEIKKLNGRYEAEMTHLEQRKKTEAAVILCLYGNGSIAPDKIKLLDTEYAKKIAELKCQMEMEHKNLEEGHLAAQNKLQETGDHWVGELKSWAQVELINNPVSRETVHNHGDLKLSDVSTTEQTANTAKSISDGEGPNETPTIPSSNDNEGDILPNLKLSDVSTTEQTANTAKSISDGEGPNETPKIPSSNDNEGDILPNLKQSFSSGPQNVSNVNGYSSKEENFDVSVTLEVAEAVDSGNGLESTMDKPSPGGQSLDGPILVEHNVGSTGCLENPATSCSSPSGETIASTHGKSDPPTENVEAEASDNVTRAVQQDGDGKSQNGEVCQGLPEPTSFDIVESSKNGKQDGDVLADGTTDDQTFHSSERTTRVNHQDGKDSLGEHETAAVLGEGSDTGGGNNRVYIMMSSSSKEVEQDVLSAPGLASASAERAEDGSSGGERHVACTVASHNSTEAVPLDDECASATTTTRLLGNSWQSGNQNALGQIEAANSHPQDASDQVNGDTLSSLDGHGTNNSGQTSAEVVDDQVERSHQSDQSDVQHATQSFQQLEISGPRSGIHVSDTVTMPIPPVTLNNLSQATPSVQVPLQSSQDPLQNELERIIKEANQTFNMHEEAKLKLKSDCEKEIAEIRTKYDTKLQEVESEFLLKKKELDANYQIVLMNKMLAEAFRSLDVRSSTAPGTQQELSFSFMQHLMQLSAQNTVQRPPVIGRPPQISSISPGTGNLQAGSEYRAPAPHLLQLLRPPTQRAEPGISYSTFPMSGQQVSNNPHTNSPLFSQLPSLSPPSVNLSGSQNSVFQPEAAGTLPSSVSSLSAVALLMDIVNQANRNAIPPRYSTQPIGVASNSDPPALSQNVALGNPASSSEVVCLSDDD